MSEQLAGLVLRGRFVRLEPLSRLHAADLAIAAEEDRSDTASPGSLVRPKSTTTKCAVPACGVRNAHTVRTGPFTHGRAVECTAYWDPRYWPGQV